MTDTAVGFTIADLEAMPDDGNRYELIGGSILVSPVPTPRHQLASGHLYSLLRESCPDGHTVFTAPVGLELPWEQLTQPDLVVVPDTSIGDKRLYLPALLVVELISPSSVLYDLNVKRDAYAQAGVEHYWVIDTRPGKQRFIAHRNADGVAEVVADDGDDLTVSAPVALDVELGALFR